jgi:cytochrome b561
VVINDGIIRLEFLKKATTKEEFLSRAIQRLRPIAITTITTFVGLSTLIFYPSGEAVIMQPLAVSLGFGLVWGTILNLFYLPLLFAWVEKFDFEPKQTLQKRYSKSRVVLHWLSVVAIGFLLIQGFFLLEQNSNPTAFALHIAVGLLVLLLVLLNLLLKPSNLEPLKLNPYRAFAVKLNHYGLYALMLFITLSGYMLASKSGIWDMLFYGIPTDMDGLKELKPAIFHLLLSQLLVGFIVIHVLGVVYYMVSKRENILRRMWSGA